MFEALQQIIVKCLKHCGSLQGFFVFKTKNIHNSNIDQVVVNKGFPHFYSDWVNLEDNFQKLLAL